MAANYYHIKSAKNNMENEKVEYQIHECKEQVRNHIRKIMYSAAMGTIFMFLLFKMEGELLKSINNSVITEVVKVGGWMFMWQAFQTLAFDLPDKIKRINALDDSIKSKSIRIQRGGKQHEKRI